MISCWPNAALPVPPNSLREPAKVVMDLTAVLFAPVAVSPSVGGKKGSNHGAHIIVGHGQAYRTRTRPAAARVESKTVGLVAAWFGGVDRHCDGEQLRPRQVRRQRHERSKMGPGRFYCLRWSPLRQYLCP